MKDNADKCHLIASNSETHQIFVSNSSIEISICEKLLGIKLIQS